MEKIERKNGEGWADIVSLDVTFRDKEKTLPIIHLWKRNDAGKFKFEDIYQFDFYIYIPKKNKHEIDEVELDYRPFDVEETNVRALDGTEVIKLIYKNCNKDYIKRIQQQFSVTYEADLKYIKRYMLDKNITFTKNRRIMFFDIETDMSLDIKDTPKEILSIAIGDNFTDNVGIFILDKESQGITREMMEDKSFFVKCPTEKEMLNEFITCVKSYNPDILCAYNLYNYDWPYLINRMRKIGVSYKDLSDVGNVYVVINEKGEVNAQHCGGRELIDWYVLMKKLYDEDKPDDYRLNTVGNHVLKIEKVKHEYKDLKELYEKDKSLFIKYNIQDVYILKELEKKVGFITKYLITLQSLIPTFLEDLKDNSVANDFYILKKYNGKIIFPSKIKREPQKFKGALTGKFFINKDGKVESMAPEKKMFDNVGVLDFSGLYPNLFRTFGISPDTIGIVGEPNSVNINGVAFTFDKIGLIPNLIGDLLELRKTYQNLAETVDPSSKEYVLYSNISTGIKKVTNSLYGFFGFSGSRLYDIKVAESVTGAGRMVIGEVFKYVEQNLGYNTIYFDTDSCFIQLKSDVNNKDDSIKEIKDLEKLINNRVNTFVLDELKVPKNYLKMEFEKRFRRVVFLGVKKRYMGSADFWKGKFLTKDKIVIKGFDLVRGTLPKPAKEIIKDTIFKFVEGESVEVIKENYTKKMSELKMMDIKKLAFKVSLGKELDEYTKTCPQHVKACYFAKDVFKIDFRKGDYPRLMYVKDIKYMKGNEVKMTDVIAFNPDTIIPDKILKAIDMERYVDSVIIKKLEPFFGVKGMNMEYVISKQNTLSSFFGDSYKKIKEEIEQ